MRATRPGTGFGEALVARIGGIDSDRRTGPHGSGIVERLQHEQRNAVADQAVDQREKQQEDRCEFDGDGAVLASPGSFSEHELTSPIRILNTSRHSLRQRY